MTSQPDSIPQGGAPASFKELLGRVTPGPYFVSHDDKQMDGDGYRAHVASGLAVIDTGREGDWPIARFCEWPTAQYIARLNPETMKVVFAALTQCANQDIFKPSSCSNASSAARTALAALNQSTP